MRVYSLGVVACSDPNLQEVLEEYMGGEDSSIANPRVGHDKQRKNDCTAKDEEWEGEVHNDDAVQEDWLGVGTLPFWPVEEAHHRRSKLDPPLQTSALSRSVVLLMVLLMALAVC